MGADGGYGPHERSRLVDEAPSASGRAPFARDRARVLHAVSLRRLGAKTQIHSPGLDDFVRTRLTHSLEVAQVGRELGAALGCDPDVVDTACLAHDLGHPPFGHNGEAALDAAATGIGGFEGNAQTLRILTRLEAKTMGPDGSSAGLNLTRASLDAATKYPWTRDAGPAGLVKFGAYADDLAAFDWLREGAPEGRRCIEAQVMDFADDVAYSVHDVEDAIATGLLPLSSLHDPGVRSAVFAKARDWYAPHLDDPELEEALTRLRAWGLWPDQARPGRPFTGERAQLAVLKNLTSGLIGRFCLAAQRATRDRHGDGRLVRYTADLVVPAESAAEIVVLKALAAHFVMDTPPRRAVQERQRELLTELVGWLREDPGLLEPMFAADHEAAADDGARLRTVVDQVASLTDVSARSLHTRLASTRPRPGASPPIGTT